MKLLIEKSDLELLLEKKRDLIGNKVTIVSTQTEMKQEGELIL